jgi:hypothetical protein
MQIQRKHLIIAGIAIIAIIITSVILFVPSYYFFPIVTETPAGIDKPTITQGFYGNINIKEINTISGLCESKPANSKIIQIRSYPKSLEKYGNLAGIISGAPKGMLLKKVQSNELGFFQIELPEGKYLFFTENNNKEICYPKCYTSESPWTKGDGYCSYDCSVTIYPGKLHGDSISINNCTK